jgi:cytochrome c peroxidase
MLMKKLSMSVCFSLAVIFAAVFSVAAEKSSVEYGKNLFNDPTLGGSTNDKTCNSCHDNGEGLDQAGKNPKLSKVINKCVTGPLKGSKLDGRNVQMRSLKMYIQSLGKE